MWRLQLVAAVFSVCVSISDMIIDSCLFLIKLSKNTGVKLLSS